VIGEEREWRELLGYLLEHHRREARSEWWKYFDRLEPDHDPIDDMDCIGGLTFDPAHEPYPDKKSRVCPLKFPEQETKIDLRVSTRVDDLSMFEKSDINCPDCGGGLYLTQKEHPPHYRCHVGHSYTENELLIRMAEVMESTFWTALRMMEERRTLLLKMARRDSERGYQSTAKQQQERAKEMETHIENLKQLLFTTASVG
jgi:hypothetical protein